MDLTVTYEDAPSRGLPHPVHCFVSLPTAVASSLNNMTPFAALTILHIKPPAASEIYVAWTGAATSTPDAIVFHPRFASTLSLSVGLRITATVMERITSTPRHSLDIATLHPLSYLSNPQTPSIAQSDFTTLSTLTSTLESSILSHIRVLYPMQTLPLHIPGTHLLVRVKSITCIPPHTAPYAVLTPGSHLAVAPPPISIPLCCFSRVIPVPPRIQPLIHAVLHGSADKDFVFATVSRKSGGLALPVRIMFRPDVPKRHVWLPLAVWRTLCLAPLEPMLLVAVGGFARGEQNVSVLPGIGEGVPVEEISKGLGVYFDGMYVDGGSIQCGARGKNELDMELDVWDSTARGVEKDEEKEIMGFGERDAVVVDDCLSKQALLKAQKKRRVVHGFCSFPEQSFCFEDSDPLRPLQAENDAVKEEDYLPLHEKENRAQLLEELTGSCQDVVHKIMLSARLLFSDDETRGPMRCEAIVVEGELGLGKTHVCKAVAALLRHLALVRTVWIRCAVHTGEPAHVSVQRIRDAFQAAGDGGPGLIVLDDVHHWVSGSGNGNNRERHISKDKHRRIIASELEYQLRRLRHMPLMALLSCISRHDLDEFIRSPGIIGNVLSLTLPSYEERAFLCWSAIKKFMLRSVHVDPFDIPSAKQQALALAKLSDGYSPQDIQTCVMRTKIAMKMDKDESNISHVNDVSRKLKEAINAMVPASRVGIKFSSGKPGEELSWNRIGGMKSVKTVMWEALQLPSMHPDVFSDVPVRLPHGMLLYGPPGCGKTMLAKTAAEESGMRHVVVKGPELMSKYIGESEAAVRRAFEKASVSAPCVLLFDEFDSLAPRRGGVSTGVSDRVVNTLLTCMDGAERLTEGVYVLATTSRPELIDPALLRPGRLDRWVSVDIPDNATERLEILICLCRNFFTDSDVLDDVLKLIALDTDGYTGADLGAIVNDASLSLGRGSQTQGTLTNSIIIEALKKACVESRPSLSKSQRAYYRRMMARFSPKIYNEGELAQKNQSSLEEAYGKRVALQ